LKAIYHFGKVFHSNLAHHIEMVKKLTTGSLRRCEGTRQNYDVTLGLCENPRKTETDHNCKSWSILSTLSAVKEILCSRGVRAIRHCESPSWGILERFVPPRINANTENRSASACYPKAIKLMFYFSKPTSFSKDRTSKITDLI